MLPATGCWPQIPALTSCAWRYHLAFRKPNSITANNYISDISTSVCIYGLLHALLVCILFSYLSSGWGMKFLQTLSKPWLIMHRYYLTSVNWHFSIDLYRATLIYIRWGSSLLKSVLTEDKAQICFICRDKHCITQCMWDILSQKYDLGCKRVLGTTAGKIWMFSSRSG